MRRRAQMTPVEWAKRINRSWIVRHHLNHQAEAWFDYLAESPDGRLERSCEMARAMCDLRDPLHDPKPWFYAGLFHLATASEARRFLDTHRITKATVPAMVDDESVQLWIDRISPETRELLDRLQQALVEATGGDR
jgi:hypothetical protein